MKKLFAVTFDIRLLVLADDECDACDVASSTLRRGECDGEINQAGGFAVEVTSVDQLQPDERGSLPWDDDREEEERTCEQILQQAKAEAGA